MRKKQLKNRTIVVAAIFFVCTVNISAQVNIGTIDPPHAAAVLDLSQKEAAAPYRGLLLPRVSLTDPDVFQLITDADDTQRSEAAGMVVYNLNECLTVSPGKGGTGIYVWSGTKWQYLGEPKDIQGAILQLSASLYGTTDANGNLRIDIPSGLDARGTISPFNLTVTYDPSASLETSANTYNSGVAFGAQTWTAVSLSISPTVYSSLQATNMSSGTGAVTATNPWTTRQTVLTFSGQKCPPSAVNRTVTLNQTNYAILAYNNADPNTLTTAKDSIRLWNEDNNTFRITSNVGWKATITEPTNIMEHNIPDTGGTDNSDNGSTPNDYTLAGKDIPDTKYKTATILLEDNTFPKRAKDYTVTVVQCQGTEDLSSVTIEADPAQTSAGDVSWDSGATPADRVVRHQAKPNPNYENATATPNEPVNIYEEFYSARFGNAGRWMTTNLAAWAYDEISHSQGTALTLSALTSYPASYWCYPNGGSGGSDATSYNNNPHLGLLYNWSAATAGKGGSTGQGNTTNEGNMAETTTNEAGKQRRIQGICPKGWHLPSDREWNELEKEIYTYPQLYSYYTDKTGWSYPNWVSTWETTNDNYRPPLSSTDAQEAHGKAMKDICGVNSNDPNGRSKSLATGGFNILLTGTAGNGSASSFGTTATLSSSSSVNYGFAWYRTLDSGHASVHRSKYGRNYLFSVRCKKD